MIATTTLGDLLKRVYDPATVEEAQNLEVPVLGMIGEGTDYRVGGDGLYFAVDMSGDEGFGYIAEQAAIPAAQNEQVKQAKVSPTVFVGAVRVTGLGRAISSENIMAFAQGLQFHFDKKMRRMTAYKEGVLFRDGKGVLLQYNGAPSDTATAESVDSGVLSWVRRNMMVELFTSADAYRGGPSKVTDIDYVNQTITLADTIAGAADNDKIVLAGTQPRTGTFVEREPLGLESAISLTGTYLNVARASYPEWESNVVNAAGTDIDEDRFLQAESRLYIIGGVSSGRIRDYRILIHPNQLRKYYELIIPRKEFSGSPGADASPGMLSWNGHEFVITHNCPETTAYMGDFSMWQKFTAPDGNMQIDTTFGPPIKWAPGYDGGIAYWREYCNYAVRMPNHWVKIHTLGNVANR